MMSMIITPWVDNEELCQVYDCIFNNQNEELLIWARNRLTIWQTRVINHEYITATQSILNAKLMEMNLEKYQQENNAVIDAGLIYSSYSMAIIRFCSLFSFDEENSNSKNEIKSIKKLAVKFSCPLWIIEYRHKLCHSTSNQPSLFQLRNACENSLNWLNDNYWKKLFAKTEPNDFTKFIENFHESKHLKVKRLICKKLEIYARKHKFQFIQSLANYFVKQENFVQKTRNNEFKLKKHSIPKFLPIFRIIHKFNCLALLFRMLLNHLSSNDHLIITLSSCWCIGLAHEFQKNTAFKFLKQTPIMNKTEWFRILYQITLTPNEYTCDLIKEIAPLVEDLISENQLHKLLKITDLFLYDDIQDDNNEKYECDLIKFRTLDDLIKSKDDEHKSHEEHSNGEYYALLVL